jgi:hypothetical protein
MVEYDTVRSLTEVGNVNQKLSLYDAIMEIEGIKDKFCGRKNQGKHVVLLKNPTFEDGELKRGYFSKIILSGKKPEEEEIRRVYDIMFPDSVRGMPNLSHLRFFDFQRMTSDYDVHSQVFHVDPFLAFLSLGTRGETLTGVKEARLGNTFSCRVSYNDI